MDAGYLMGEYRVAVSYAQTAVAARAASYWTNRRNELAAQLERLDIDPAAVLSEPDRRCQYCFAPVSQGHYTDCKRWDR